MNYLDRLPDEIIGCIFEQLDSLSTIYQFLLTCHRIHSITSTTPRLLACWLVKQQGPRFAIYYAILSMPHLCDDRFIQLLLNQGALLSRHLVQQLVLLYGKSSSSSCISSSQFSQSLQQLPFSGYATLIHQGSRLYGNIMVTKTQMDYTQLMASTNIEQWQMAIQDHYFVPAPVIHGPSSYSRSFLRLVIMRPDLFNLFSPVFGFDLEARCALWESIFLYLLDLSFSHHSTHHDKLALLDRIITPKQHIRFVLSKEHRIVGDQDAFVHSFISFFGKYTHGYLADQFMNKLLGFLFDYIHPSFDLKLALLEISETLPPTRKDISHLVKQFLKCRSLV
ncbi:uncharacterized protein BX664DRAFT_314774 [Halteromyces radiatus]|uniref:uncharacterized protein n=1 Tax=Halteromyces radiatus TaxID=101107 RepID=UPI00222113FA|nr:uncharacterized protein BX664DRAFT_314774 [Halteromyces radiatus]KAI8089581.1 hypothetical protein BX664DRAFT_314774 [Halteromyces radiatus]